MALNGKLEIESRRNFTSDSRRFLGRILIAFALHWKMRVIVGKEMKWQTVAVISLLLSPLLVVGRSDSLGSQNENGEQLSSTLYWNFQPRKNPDRKQGRKLKIISSSVSFQSNNQAFSASVDATPSYLARALGRTRGKEGGGITAALAYGADLRPSNFFRSSTSRSSRNTATSPELPRALARTEAEIENGTLSAFFTCAKLTLSVIVNGQQKGRAYAEAYGNVASYSSSYLHLFDEDEDGHHLKARSQVEAAAMSAKEVEEIRDLFRFSNEAAETSAEVDGLADASVTPTESVAEQTGVALTDTNEGGTKCSEIKILGEVTENTPFGSNELLRRRFSLVSRC